LNQKLLTTVCVYLHKIVFETIIRRTNVFRGELAPQILVGFFFKNQKKKIAAETKLLTKKKKRSLNKNFKRAIAAAQTEN
jgi:hypothetical protein